MMAHKLLAFITAGNVSASKMIHVCIQPMDQNLRCGYLLILVILPSEIKSMQEKTVIR